MKKLNVCILFGGISPEHEVSLRSAESVLNNIDKDSYNLFPVGITREGEWILFGGTDYSMLPKGTWKDYPGNRRAAISPVRGQGLRRNVRMDLVDCLVGITYTELGSIGNFAEISDRAAAEAWKAQAVAIHSYLEYQNQYGSSANALTYTPVDQIPSSTRKQMENAIEEVADLILVYDAGGGYSVCDAVFSCSAGYNTQTGVYGTCSAKDAWGTDVPYLQSVESPYEEQYHNILRRVVGKDYRMLEYNDSRHPDEPYVSADTSHKSLGGFVQYDTLVVNGRSYRYLNQFVSSRYCFDFTADANGTPVMAYYGYGHGVGMSQCGAVGFAQERGYDYRQILSTYYTGASLMDSSDGSVSSGGFNLWDFLFGWLPF